jgi:hypothetical protein
MNSRWLCLVGGAFLLLAIPSGWPYSFYILLRWVIFFIALIVANETYKNNINGWALVFLGMAFLFNPILPVYLSKSSWVMIDFVGASLFFIGGYIKQGKNK